MLQSLPSNAICLIGFQIHSFGYTGDKMHKLTLSILFASLLSGTVNAEKVVVALSPLQWQGKDSSRAAQISAVMQAELSGSDHIRLVERETLDSILGEMKLGAQGLVAPDAAAKLGSVAGAQYICSVNLIVSQDQIMAVVKGIQIESTLSRMKYAYVAQSIDSVEFGKTLAANVEALISEFNSDSSVRGGTDEASTAKKVMPADWKRPSVMVLIPEMHVRQPELIDPAAETEIVKRLIADGFRVINSEYIVLAKADPKEAKRMFGSLKTSADHAAKKGADILIYGEAISERGAVLGDFEGCRGRVELKAIHTGTDEILVSDSTESGATDLSETIAGKKAIRQAATQLADTFLYQLAERWNNR